MFCKLLVRNFHLSHGFWASQKSALASLRKKTGYTFANCKKALELHNNDLQKAEAWLNEQAQSLGWSKATKLQGRQTRQGLIGVLVKDNIASMVEVNCETDFVAKNENFHTMVDTAAKICIQYADIHRTTDDLTKFSLDENQLKSLKAFDGKPLSDHLALMIGTVGENAVLRRAICYKANNPDIYLSGYAHPSGVAKEETLLGRFAGIVAIKPTQKYVNVEELGKKLCQHVVGMDPKTIGYDIEKTEENSEENKDDETSLIHQEYLLDDSMTVKEFLEENSAVVVDFNRFGCGEQSMNEQNLENIETCQ